ncbi:MAG: hypothetical protein IIW65_08030 [Alistipes sp.]|nr:hypothetical protein [Alistipes sp.]
MEIVLLIVLLVILLIVLAVEVFIAYIVMHKPAKKSDRKVVYRSRVISNPKYDLLTKEKFAIIRIFLFIMGSDEMLAKKVEANLILANMVDSLGIRPQDVTKLVKDDLGRNSENLAEEIVESLSEIRDVNYLSSLRKECDILLMMSNNLNTIALVSYIFNKVICLNEKF